MENETGFLSQATSDIPVTVHSSSSIDRVVFNNSHSCLENDIAEEPLCNGNLESDSVEALIFNCSQSDTGEDSIECEQSEKEEPNECEQRDKVITPTPKALMTLNTQERPLKFECQQCGKCFAHSKPFSKHKKVHIKAKKRLKCKECGKLIKGGEYNLERHLRTHASKSFKCGQCNMAFRIESLFKQHSRIHTGERPFECEQCGRCFKKTSQNLKEHQKIHTKEKFKCMEWGRHFSEQIYLSEHIMNSHLIDKPFKFKKCRKCFTLQCALDRHIQIHPGRYPFNCKECGRGFKLKAKFAYHMGKHRNERKEKIFQCGLCIRKFTSKCGVKRHMRNLNIHTPKVPKERLKYHECGKDFAIKSLLDQHMRIHTGERPFKCELCEKSYPAKGYHMASHTEDIWFKCVEVECKKTFRQKRSLDDHMRQHTGEKPFQCWKCGKCFTIKDSLRIHLKNKTYVFQKQIFKWKERVENF